MHQISSLKHTEKAISFPKCFIFPSYFTLFPKAYSNVSLLWSQLGLDRSSKFGVTFPLQPPHIKKLQSNDFLIFSETAIPVMVNKADTNFASCCFTEDFCAASECKKL